MAADGDLSCLPFSLNGMRVWETAGDDYRTSHPEVKWADDLFLMNLRLRTTDELGDLKTFSVHPRVFR